MNLMEILSIVIILIGLLIIIITSLLVRNNYNLIVSIKEKKARFCILIPARDESKVIRDLLISIKNQTRLVDFNDVYVIIEDINDLTSSIAYEY